MIASRGPSAAISATASERSSSPANSWPTSSSASSTFGETTSGSARTAWRSGSPSVSTTVITSKRSSSLISDAYRSGSTPRGSEPANTTIAAPRARYSELVAKQLDLPLGHRRTAFVDLGLFAGGRIEHRGVGARLLADAHEVVEDRLLGQLLDDVRPGGAAGEAGGDHRLPEGLQRARDVHALAARARPLVHGAVAPSQPEVRHRQRLVDRRVERDRDDHPCVVYPPSDAPHGRRCRWRARTNRLADAGSGSSAGLFRERPRLLAQPLGARRGGAAGSPPRSR